MAEDQFDRWINRVISRADELRSKGVLSIGVDDCTAMFAPIVSTPDDDAAEDDDADPAWVEPKSAWEDPATYPSGIVPQLEIDDLSGERR